MMHPRGVTHFSFASPSFFISWGVGVYALLRRMYFRELGLVMLLLTHTPHQPVHAQSMMAQATQPNALFVRRGIALLGPWSARARSQLRVERATGSIKVVPQAMPARAGWLVSLPWERGEQLTLRWGQGSMPLQAPFNPSPWVLSVYHWPTQKPLWGKHPDKLSALAFSADGHWLASGSTQGRVAVWRLLDGEKVYAANSLFSHVRQLVFAPHGRLLVATQSPQGRLVAYAWQNARRTKPLWVWDAAPIIGQATPAPKANEPYGWVRYPGVFRLLQKNNTVWAFAARSWRTNRGDKRAASVLVELNASNGQLQWRWPQHAPAKGLMLWAQHAPTSHSLASTLQAAWGAKSKTFQPNPSKLLVWPLQNSQKPVQYLDVPPVDNKAFTSFWRGIGFAPEGDRLAFSSEDGRGFLLKKTLQHWQITHQWRVLKPLRIAGAWISASNGQLLALRQGVVFGAGESYAVQAPASHIQPKPTGNTAPTIDDGKAIHPHGNTLWAYNWQAKLQWIVPLANSLQSMRSPANTPWLALQLGGNTTNSKHAFQGLQLLRLSHGKQTWQANTLYRLRLQGVSVFNGLAFSPNANTLALAEAPRTSKQRHAPVGKNRIWIIH